MKEFVPAGRGTPPRFSSPGTGIWPWLLVHHASIFAAALPFVFLSLHALAPAGENWQHIREWLLTTCVIDTALVTLSGVAGAMLLGVAAAWMVCLYRFPGKTFLEWALVLPLAIPPYISAYIWYHLIGYTGAFQIGLRALGVDVKRFGPEIPPSVCAVFVFATTLYPYVYLVVKAYLKEQSASLFENARLLGGGPLRSFFGVFLPLLLPAAASGGALAGFEILSDFGVTSYFGIHTFSTAIFSAWFGMSDVESASRLSVLLLVMVFAVAVVCRLLQRPRKYQIVSSRERRLLPVYPSRFAAWSCTFLCTAILLFSAGIPVAQLLAWLALSFDAAALPRLYSNMMNTMVLAGSATLCIVLMSLGAVYATRLAPTKGNLAAVRLASAGYAVPGAVLAMGTIALFAFLSRSLTSIGLPGMIRPSATTGMLLFACTIRFFAAGCHAVEAGFARVGPVCGEAARTLGAGPARTFFQVDLPMIRNAVLGGAVLTFVDVVKELPLTLILRPFNFNTLGTSVYDFAHNEIMHEIALPSLTIILLCAIFLTLAALLDRTVASSG